MPTEREINCKGNMNLDEFLDVSGLLPDLSFLEVELPDFEIELPDLDIDMTFLEAKKTLSSYRYQ